MLNLKSLFSTANSSRVLSSRRTNVFIILLLTIMALGAVNIVPTNAMEIMSPLYSMIMWGALICLGISIVFLFIGKTKIPGEVQFSNLSWFGLLFTTGMGIGLLNYMFQESMQLGSYNDTAHPLGQVINHWTLIPWGMYTCFTIFEVYDLKYNLTPKWFKEIKSQIYALAMTIGVGVSFALAVLAISGALQYVYGISIPPYAVIVLLGLLIVTSVLRGINKGLRLFSNITLFTFFGYLILLLFQCDGNLFKLASEGLSSFVNEFFYNNTYHGSKLQIDWTEYYWVWWACWIPFTAPFAIEVSKGRSIRQLVAAFLIVPSILIVLCMCIGSNLGSQVQTTDPNIIPFLVVGKTWYLPIIFIFLMAAFFETSADSEAVAIDSVISRGSKVKLVYRKIGWVLLEMFVVTFLMLVGGNSISVFTNIMLFTAPLIYLIGIIFIYYLIKYYIKNHKLDKVKSSVIIIGLLCIPKVADAQIPYYAGTQGKDKLYTYFSTKFHPGHNDQQVYITAQYGLTNHIDLVTETYACTGWGDQGFGVRLNGINSRYFSLGGQLMVDFNLHNNYKYDWTCGSLYLNGEIYKSLHWVSNTWCTKSVGSSKFQVDQWTYLGWTVNKYTPMIGLITDCTNNFKSDLAVGCYANLYKNGYIYLWGSGLTNNVYNLRLIIGFDYKFNLQ